VASYRLQGARVYTFFMYLSTPEAGGGTRFTDLNLTVPAVKGSAVLWPSVTSDDPDIDEPLTHRAWSHTGEGHSTRRHPSRAPTLARTQLPIWPRPAEARGSREHRHDPALEAASSMASSPRPAPPGLSQAPRGLASRARPQVRIQRVDPQLRLPHARRCRLPLVP